MTTGTNRYGQYDGDTIHEELPGAGVPSAKSPRYDYSQPFGRNISGGELASGVIVFLLWILFFTLGLFVPTLNMRNTLWGGGADSLVTTLGLAMAVGASYTLTNILFLSCIASFLGGMAHRWQVGEGLESIPPDARSVAATRVYMAALLRGFFLYLMFISGFLLVSTEQTVTETNGTAAFLARV